MTDQMEDEEISAEAVEEVEDPAEALEHYAHLLEQRQQENAQQAQVINRCNAQIEALKQSLMEQTESTVYMRSELMLANQQIERVTSELDHLKALVGLEQDEA